MLGRRRSRRFSSFISFVLVFVFVFFVFYSRSRNRRRLQPSGTDKNPHDGLKVPDLGREEPERGLSAAGGDCRPEEAGEGGRQGGVPGPRCSGERWSQGGSYDRGQVRVEEVRDLLEAVGLEGVFVFSELKGRFRG